MGRGEKHTHKKRPKVELDITQMCHRSGLSLSLSLSLSLHIAGFGGGGGRGGGGSNNRRTFYQTFASSWQFSLSPERQLCRQTAVPREGKGRRLHLTAGPLHSPFIEPSLLLVLPVSPFFPLTCTGRGGVALLFSWFTCQPPHQHCRPASCREAPADAVFNAHSRFVLFSLVFFFLFFPQSPHRSYQRMKCILNYVIETHTHNTHAFTHAPPSTHTLSPFSYACSHTQVHTSCVLVLGSPFYKLAFIHTLYTPPPPPPAQE